MDAECFNEICCEPPTGCAPCDKPKKSCNSERDYDGYKGYSMSNSVGALIVWFFIIFVVTVLALYALTPTFVLKKNSFEVDNGKAILTAFIISLFIVLLIFLVKAVTMKYC